MSYDVVTAGGGLGGAGFAKLMAARGAKVPVLERPTEFRHRVRGEVLLMPWGVAEARSLRKGGGPVDAPGRRVVGADGQIPTCPEALSLGLRLAGIPGWLSHARLVCFEVDGSVGGRTLAFICGPQSECSRP